MNYSREEIIKDIQKTYNRRTYIFDNMAACMDKGLYRKIQEDAVLLLSHPLLSNFKLLAIADGMGGLNQGEKASNTTLLEIIRWFETTPISYYEKELPLYKEIIKKINEIDGRIRRLYSDSGTTLSLAIITKYNSQLINIGDSRIYLSNDKSFFQISEDHSLTWNMYKNSEITKEMIRFHKQNNLITSKIGGEKKNLIIDNKIIQNDEYNKLILFSDGVTDCLSEETIEKIINDDNIPLEIKVELVINKALYTKSINNYLDTENYYNIINGGKDNASVAIYKKLK